MASIAALKPLSMQTYNTHTNSFNRIHIPIGVLIGKSYFKSYLNIDRNYEIKQWPQKAGVSHWVLDNVCDKLAGHVNRFNFSKVLLLLSLQTTTTTQQSKQQPRLAQQAVSYVCIAN